MQEDSDQISKLVKEYKKFAHSRYKQGLHESSASTGVATTLAPDEFFAVIMFACELPGLRLEPSIQERLCFILRERDPKAMEAMNDFLCYLYKGLRNLCPLDGVAYAGILAGGREKLLQRQYQEGSELHWPTFRTLSLCPAAAKEAAGSGGVVLRFHVRSARKLAFLGLEQAVVFPNSRFRVAGKLCSDAAEETLDLEEIDGTEESKSDDDMLF